MRANKKHQTVLVIVVLLLCLFHHDNMTHSADFVTVYGPVQVGFYEGSDEGLIFYGADKFLIPDARIEFTSLATGETYTTYSDSIGNYEINLPIENVGVTEHPPASFLLHQNYPNPFNPTTTIRYDLAEPGNVSLDIYNMSGQNIATLVDGWQDTGTHTIPWDGRDRTGYGVSAGVYVYQLRTAGRSVSRKMTLLDGASSNSVQYQPSMGDAARSSSGPSYMEYSVKVEKDGYETHESTRNIYLSEPTERLVLRMYQLDYFPLEVGNSWTFELIPPRLGQQFVTYTITETKEIKGNTYYKFDSFPIFFHYRSPEHPYPDDTFVRKDASNSLRIWEGTTDVMLYLFTLPEPTRPLTVKDRIDDLIGSVSTWFYYFTPECRTYLNSVNETIGELYPCYEFHVWSTLVDGTQITLINDTLVSYWFAPEIGPVKIATGWVPTYVLYSARIGGVEYNFGEE